MMPKSLEKTPLLTVHQLNAWFGSTQVIKDVSLTVYPNEIVALIGPSGCGKSTFLRCLNRLHEETPLATVQGEVLLENKNIYTIDPVDVRRKIGMVFQKPNPFPSMSIFDNVAAGLKLAGIKKRSILEEQVEKALKQASLWEEVSHKLPAAATSLSGGQQQRLCIARALAISPSVILMDEPTSALDPISTKRIEELILDLKKDITIIIVTHNMQQAARISDNTAFLLLGDLIEFDETSKIFTNPVDERTESYITGKFG